MNYILSLSLSLYIYIYIHTGVWASLVAQMVKNLPTRREWLPTPVFLPGEFHGQ